MERSCGPETLVLLVKECLSKRTRTLPCNAHVEYRDASGRHLFQYPICLLDQPEMTNVDQS